MRVENAPVENAPAAPVGAGGDDAAGRWLPWRPATSRASIPLPGASYGLGANVTLIAWFKVTLLNA